MDSSRGLGADDGITTGWICVNLGPVDEAQIEAAVGKEEVNEVLAEEEYEKEEYENPVEGFVGFGSRSTAPRVVVQMFTEEKRAEMDLEGLWDVRQERRKRKDEKGDKQAEEAVMKAETDETSPDQDVVMPGNQHAEMVKKDFVEIRPSSMPLINAEEMQSMIDREHRRVHH